MPKPSNNFGSTTLIAESIDLHHIRRHDVVITEDEVFDALDAFMMQMKRKYESTIKRFGTVKIGIICGKGLNSRRRIEGKNPLRAYSEKYINTCGYRWRNGNINEGENGIIVVDVV